jgi:hypothetical protein
MTDSQKQLLNIISSSLFNSSCKLSDTVDWNEVFQEAKDQTVVGLLVPFVKQLPEDITVPNLSQWIEAGNQLYANYVRNFHAQKEIVGLFEKNGIPIVIVKGYAAAVYYPSACIRTMGDIDFLVPKDRFDEAQLVMEKAGYQQEFGVESESSRHIGYFKNNTVYEMHRSMSSFGIDIDTVINRGLEQSKSGVIANNAFPMLPPLENGLVLLTHIRQHLLEEEYSLGLRQIIDWMLYVNKYSGLDLNGVVWDSSFMSLVQQYRLDTLAINITFMCKEWLGLPKTPAWCEKANRDIADELLEMILENGNFGSKLDDSDRSIKELIVVYGQTGVFNWLQSHGIANWKAAQKYKILKPFAWLYQACRSIGIGIKALFSRKHSIRQINDGYKKRVLMKRLGI